MKISVIGCVIWVGVIACGPSVGEVRLKPAPAREANCQLKFLDQSIQELSAPDGEWETVAQITLSEEGVQDPFAERYRAIVRPRACALGGEAVALFTSAVSEGLVSSGTATIYGVLRRKSPSGAGAPESF